MPFCLTEKRVLILRNELYLCGPIAQLVELPAHNRMVGGSTPSGPTIFSFFATGGSIPYYIYRKESL